MHNHHSAAEDMHMLWQQIRHSEEQQTFSTSSNGAALSAVAHAARCYCSQAAVHTLLNIRTGKHA